MKESSLLNHRLPSLSDPIAVPNDDDSLKASAVLIILHQVNEQWQLLFTKRASHLKHHAGQISFPGGRFEDVDRHLIDTAVRETEEEIGLSRNYIKVISQLQHQPTLTGYRIYPFVALSKPLPQLVIEENEVDEIFSVPLDFLINSDNQHKEVVQYNGVDYDLYKIVWKERLIWGATARMIVELSEYINADALAALANSPSQSGYDL